MNDWRVETGDAMRLIPTLEDGSVSLVFTSPPYPGQKGNTQSAGKWLIWLGVAVRLLCPRLAPAAVLALNVTMKRTAAGWFDTCLRQGVTHVRALIHI